MKTTKLYLGLIALAAVGFAATQQAQADITAYQVSPGTVGNQNWPGALGLDFTVNSAIDVTSLGVFDSGADGLANDLTAYIYTNNGNNTGTLLVTESFAAGTGPSSGTLVGGSRFLSLGSPLLLGPGNYTVVADGYSTAEPNYNEGFYGTVFNPTTTENNGGGLITFTGFGRYAGSPGVFPNIVDSGPNDRYDAGTFTYHSAVVPEPASMATMAFGILALGGFMLIARKRQANAA